MNELWALQAQSFNLPLSSSKTTGKVPDLYKLQPLCNMGLALQGWGQLVI